MRRALLLAATLVACAGEAGDPVGSSSSSIVGGDADAADPAVVLIASANCTGTLVAPRAVLTAAHCDVAAGAAVTFSDGTSIAALAFHAHPGWDPISARNDIAVVVLAEASSVAPIPISTAPITDALVGARVRVVGYGETADGGAAGTKHSGLTTIAGYDDMTFTDSAQPAASCAGDSGGPALVTVDGVERVAGVTSRGDVACAAFGVKTRVDAYAASFLVPAIAATGPGALGVGKACDVDLECASGRCVAAVDSERVHYCSASCARDRDCPGAMRCHGGACQYDPPSPGAPGAPCEANGDCAGQLCAARAYGGPRTCAVLCEAAAASPCASGFTCALGEDGTSRMCFPVQTATVATARGGCEVGGAEPSDGIGGIAAMLGALLAHLRGRRTRRPRHRPGSGPR